MISDSQLKYWYDKYNKKYFGGELPDAVVYWEPSPRNHAVTCPVFEVADNVFEVKIDPALKGVTQFWKQTLMHEMIHVKIWKTHPKHSHGKLFQDEKDKLYAQGALRSLW